jgi:hypothetical protein
MTVWDILILTVTLALVVEGLWKGAVRLAFGLAGLLAGYLYAGYLADQAAGYLTFLVQHMRRPVAVTAGFLLIFTLSVLVGAIISAVVKKSGLGCLNRLLGAALGLAASVYVAAGLVHLSARFSPDYPAKLTAGPVMRLMSEWAVGMETLLPPVPGLSPKPVEAPPAPAVPPAKEAAPKSKGDAT